MDPDLLAERFEEHRGHLRAVAYRMLGSINEADDAVQEAWLRLSRSDSDAVDNLGGWLTTVVGRVCLDMLRTRKSRREDSLDARLPDPIVSGERGVEPEQEALIADSVGLAMLVVLEALTPAERIAFVLHDTFGVPFDEVAPIIGRTPVATRKLASRARQRVRGVAPAPDGDLRSQRKVVDAFLAAARDGDFERLLAVLDPNIVLRADTGGARTPGLREVRGAQAVANQAATFARADGAGASKRPVLVNGAIGVVALRDGKPYALHAYTVRGDRIVAIDVLADPERLRALDIAD